MAAIITGTHGSVAFWNGAAIPENGRAFGPKGQFTKPELCSFAGLSAFADNSNHAPAGFEGAITWDIGIDFLFRIAGAH